MGNHVKWSLGLINGNPVGSCAVKCLKCLLLKTTTMPTGGGSTISNNAQPCKPESESCNASNELDFPQDGARRAIELRSWDQGSCNALVYSKGRIRQHTPKQHKPYHKHPTKDTQKKNCITTKIKFPPYLLA